MAIVLECDKSTYFTAGARPLSVTVTKPAALTAVACNKPIAILVPTGIASISGLPMSSTTKKNQSVQLLFVN